MCKAPWAENLLASNIAFPERLLTQMLGRTLHADQRLGPVSLLALAPRLIALLV